MAWRKSWRSSARGRGGRPQGCMGDLPGFCRSTPGKTGRRFRDAAENWKAGEWVPKRAWSLEKAAEVEPEEFSIHVVNDAFTQYKAFRPIAEGLSESNVRRKLEGWGLAATEIDARIQHARKYPNPRLAKALRIPPMSDIPRVDIRDPLKNACNTKLADIAKQETDENIVGWWRNTADENDERAKHLEELAYEMFNLDDAGFMLREVKLLQEQDNGSGIARLMQEEAAC